MAKTKVLISVTTYPLPSSSYDELVCTAGVLENGEWIRIYPVPLSFLIDLKDSGKLNNVKYTWVELELSRRTDDLRPESHSPKHRDFRDLLVLERLDTRSNWLLRKQACLKKVYTNMTQLIEDSKKPKYVSLATFKPSSIIRLEWKEDEREWKDTWKEIRKQRDLFAPDKDPEVLIPKLPYKFSYVFKDDTGKERRLMIEDWEIGALYWNCLKQAEGDEAVALQKLWHTRAKNPFIIIGVFYPKLELQTSLF
jgi:hypothetical protein